MELMIHQNDELADKQLAVIGGAGELGRRLEEHAADARGAYSKNTERALRSDSSLFAVWCAARNRRSLPASPATVAAFVDSMGFSNRAVASVRRYVASIAHLHRAAGLADPCASEKVRLALKRLARTKGTRQAQAKGLNRPLVDRMLQAAGSDPAGLRNRALLALAYDAMLRRSELVGLEVADLEVDDDGAGTVLIRRSKTDAEGAGQVRFLSAATVAAVRDWLEVAQIEGGPIFRGLTKGGRARAGSLDAGTVARLFREMAKAAGVDPAGISGHSTRVGSAQDQAAAGLELASIMRSGGWKTPAMVARYTDRLDARRSAAAQLAVIQGRA